jgi:hypothetical protein
LRSGLFDRHNGGCKLIHAVILLVTAGRDLHPRLGNFFNRPREFSDRVAR